MTTGYTSIQKLRTFTKIFDNRYADDVFLGSDGLQVVRSEGGFDTATGGKGYDVFRVDGSMLTDADWGDQQVYDFVGHQLKVTDYEYGELLSVEDFGLTSASQIYSTIENGYTKIWAETDWGEYHPLKLVGEFDSGVVYSRGTNWSDLGVDYGVEFFDASKALMVPLALMISQCLAMFGGPNSTRDLSFLMRPQSAFCSRVAMAMMTFRVVLEMTISPEVTVLTA